ncbi:NepR family anti-sigma factor [Roseobacter sp. GAI101]|uniref:NepR family anti-sigma factor n=1 Tax=Roseobacter sp. (strain GAI101) TaxID=391589 RepID=UPI0020C7E41D|nr:NepR family anti-sigma factor [Roseobacter sp. GAI101]
MQHVYKNYLQVRNPIMHSGQNKERERFIDENLRRVYEETVDEGIPDKFAELLNKLKEQEKENGASK